MPLYEYSCRSCGETFERLRSLHDADAPVACSCGSQDVGRIVFSRVAVGRSASAASAFGASERDADACEGGVCGNEAGACCGGDDCSGGDDAYDA